jgi:hypothetical protein
MWILFARSPKPDARYWAGRRCFAALDALAWPAVLMALVIRAPYPTGIFGQVLLTLVAIAALRTLHIALWRNERYWFAVRRWAMPVAILFVVAEVLKVLG